MGTASGFNKGSSDERCPIPDDLEPMLAGPQSDWPEGGDWSYEPKWDGFRTIIHAHGDRVELISRGARPMTRYFPEVVAAFRGLGDLDVVLDGELIQISSKGLDFEALQQRIHPAESRIRKLSGETPVDYVAFDVLALGGEDLRGLPQEERRGRLEEFFRDTVGSGSASQIHMTPRTRDAVEGRRWFEEFEGAGLDGVIAKRGGQPYVPGKRLWVKLKHLRTADCVVIGFRWSSDHAALGSLLLGLYDQSGRLHYVGHTSSFDAATRRQLLVELAPLHEDLPPPGSEETEAMGRAPGGASRWSRGRDTDWQGLRPELVCEVSYDKLQSGQRFRHATGFIRWRPDRAPDSCTFEQIEEPPDFQVGRIFAR